MNTFSEDDKVTETHTFPFGIDELCIAFMQAINDKSINHKRYTVKDASWNLYRVVLHTRATLDSWGELMTIQFTSVGVGAEVTISSQFLDCTLVEKEIALRKNKKNIADILRILKHSCYGED